MAGDNHTASSLFRRAEQLKRWKESETNRQDYSDRPKNNKVTFSSGCIFLAAAAAGDKDEIRILLDRGADINTFNSDGITALHAACIDQNLSVVEYLVGAGADVNRCDMEGWTPMHATGSCGSLSIAKFLLERGADLSLVNNDGELPVDVADDPDMVAFLQQEMVARGVDGKAARSREERCMLADATQWLHNGKVEDVPHPTTGATALHVAAAKGYIRVIRLLLEAGVDVNCKDHDGWTPLHAAVHWEQTEAVELLCESSADMTATNLVGQTPLDLANDSLRPMLEEFKRQQASYRNSARKRKTSPGREPSKRKESHTHVRETENGPKENATENGKVVNSASLDATEIQSWRRPSSLRAKSNKEAGLTVTGREPLTERSLSSPNNHVVDDEASERPAATPTSLRRTVSFDRENRNTRDSMVRVSALQDGLLAASNATTTTTTTTTTSNSSSTTNSASATASVTSSSPPSATNTVTVTASSPPSRTSNSNNTSIGSSTTTITTTTSTTSPSTAVAKDTPAVTASSTSTTATPPSSSSSSASAANSNVSPNRMVGRSFVPPSRDDESETQRKANARLIRSSRRSTQGVSLDDLKTAETLYKPGGEGQDKGSTTETASPNGSKKQEEEDRRPSWKLKIDDNDKNRFCLEDVRGGKDGGASNGSAINNGVQLRNKTGDDRREDDSDQRNSAGGAGSTEQSREGSRAAIQRRKKPKRRSTGVVHVDLDEIDPEKRAQKQQQEQEQQLLHPQQDSESNDAAAVTNVSERGDASKAGSSVSLASSGSTGSDGDIDYKKLYEEQLVENERLVERLRGCEQEVRSLKDTNDANVTRVTTAETDRREKRALERKLAEMEEELKVLEQLRQENKKLWDENGALIRVISKLSR